LSISIAVPTLAWGEAKIVLCVKFIHVRGSHKLIVTLACSSAWTPPTTPTSNGPPGPLPLPLPPMGHQDPSHYPYLQWTSWTLPLPLPPIDHLDPSHYLYLQWPPFHLPPSLPLTIPPLTTPPLTTPLLTTPPLTTPPRGGTSSTFSLKCYSRDSAHLYAFSGDRRRGTKGLHYICHHMVRTREGCIGKGMHGKGMVVR